MTNNRGLVHFGCCDTAPESWTNFDISPTLRLQRLPLVGSFITRKGIRFPKNVRYGDILQGLPIEDNSCDAIFCSHVLEHLSLEDLRLALKNTFRYLKPGGIFRCVLPDLEFLARQYLENQDDRASLNFMQSSYLGKTTRARKLSGFIRSWFGNSNHLWMWDYKSLSSELRDAAFVNIRRAAFGDSSLPAFADVEKENRWTNCLGIESNKPTA